MAAQQGGQADLRLEHLRSPLPALGQDQFPGLGPHPVGHLLSETESDPGHQQLIARQRTQVRIGGGQTMAVQRPVEDGQVPGQVVFAGLAQPLAGLASRAQRVAGVDDRGSASGHQRMIDCSLGIGLALATGHPPALHAAQRGQHQHVPGHGIRRSARGAQQVTTIRWPQTPRNLDLAEAEVAGDRR